MKEMYFERKDCRLCGCTKLDKVIPLPALPVHSPNVGIAESGQKEMKAPADVYLCNNCGLLQLLYIIDPEFQYKNFMYKTSVSLGLNEHFEKF